METYFPTTDDGQAQFYDYGCQQLVTQDGLTTDSPVAATMAEHGQLRTGKATKASKLANQIILEPGTDGMAVRSDYNPADATANNAPAAPPESKAQSPAAEDPADHKPTPNTGD